MSDRQHAHELIDRLPDIQISALVGLLETMIDQEDEELTSADRAAIQAGIDSLDKGGGVPMEDVLADFGLTTADFERMVSEP